MSVTDSAGRVVLRARSQRLLGLAAGLLGLVTLIAPFAGGTSPLGALRLALELEASDGAYVFSIALPYFLAIPLTVWQVRRALRLPETALEIVVARLSSGAALLPLLVVTALMVIADEGSLTNTLGLSAGWLTLIAMLGALVRLQRQGAPARVSAEVLLLLAAVPNAAYTLILFSNWGMVFGARWMWDAGAYVALAAYLLSVACAAALLVRASRDVG